MKLHDGTEIRVYFREHELDLDFILGSLNCAVTLSSDEARKLAEHLKDWADKADKHRFGN